MRTVFTGLHDLFEYYALIRLELRAPKSQEPPKPEVERITRKYGAHITKMNKEEKFAFIGDVKLFVKRAYEIQAGPVRSANTIIPFDCYDEIFHCKMSQMIDCPLLTPHNTYGKLAIYFARQLEKDPRAIPKRLKYQPNLCNIASDMMKKAARYYEEKGIIIYPKRTPYNFITQKSCDIT